MATDWTQFFQPNAFGAWAPRTGGSFIGATQPSLTPSLPGVSAWGANLGFGGAMPQLAAPAASPAPVPPTPAQSGGPVAAPVATPSMATPPVAGPMNITPPAAAPTAPPPPPAPSMASFSDPASAALAGAGASPSMAPAAGGGGMTGGNINYGGLLSGLGAFGIGRAPTTPPPMTPMQMPAVAGMGMLSRLGFGAGGGMGM